jgi:hypothetical protein
MPFSTTTTHPFMCEYMFKRIEKSKKKKFTVLDCGVGGGLIANSILDYDHNVYEKRKIDIEITGVEVFGDYIKNPEMIEKLKKDQGVFHDLYEKIHIEPFHKHLKEMKGKYDFIIFGDSLEHCYPDIAESSLAYAIKKSNIAVMINLPTGRLDQGTVYGNQYEAHLIHWKRENMEAFGAEYLGGEGAVSAFFIDPKKWKKSGLSIPKILADQNKKHKFNSDGTPNK